MSESEQDVGTVAEPVESQSLADALIANYKAASEPVASPETPSEPAKVEVGESKVEASKDSLQPLEKWSDPIKTRFTSLDRETQQFLLDREKDIESHLTKRTQELSETQKRYSRLDEVLKPYENLAKQSGVDLTPHVKQALDYYTSFNRDPLGTIKTLIAAGRITPEQLGFGEPNPNEDPNIGALRTRLEQTERELANFKQGQNQATEAQFAQQIEAFQTAKDEKGEPKYPHFETVRELMAPLVAKGQSLDEAYKAVVWIVPEHREASEKAAIAKAEKAAKEKADKERMAKVRAAKTAETLPAADTDKGAGRKNLSQVGGWYGALQETMNQTQQ